jgi:ADP-ribose pyrophosphatase YjhB (NUDIX family)
MSSEKVFPRVGVAAIVMRGSQILLGRSKKSPIENKWVLPGGGVQPFESISDTVIRELKEETGVTVKPGAVLFVSELVQPPDHHHIVIYVDAEFVDGNLHAGDDLADVIWQDVRQLGEMQDTLSDMTVDALHKFSMVLKARAMQRSMFGPEAIH